jgi:hypothetical protein
VKLTKIVGVGKRARSEVLLNERTLLGFVEIRRHEVATKKKLMGEINIGVEEKLNDVFGPYTSLGVSIGLKFPGDVNNFEGEIDKFVQRADKKVKESMNTIAAQSNVDAPWGGKKKG